MANAYTTTFLLAAIKRRGLVPTSQSTFTDAELLAMATEELQTYLVDLLVGVRENYGLVTSTVAITSGTQEYYIPERAVGGNPKRVLILANTSYIPLVRVEPEREFDFGTSGTVQGYILKGNQVRLVPAPTSSGTLQFEYYQRPNRLVELTAVAQVSVAAAVGATSVTVSSTLPGTITTSTPCDFVKGKPGFDTLATDLTPSAASGTTWSYSTGLPVALEVGDYICLAKESPIPQIPVELHPILAQRTAFKVMEALGRSDKAAMLEKVGAEMASKVRKLLAPRAEGASRVIVNRYAPGWRRSSWRR